MPHGSQGLILQCKPKSGSIIRRAPCTFGFGCEPLEEKRNPAAFDVPANKSTESDTA